MTKIDQYESVFRSADKAVYAYHRVEPSRILVISDLDGEPALRFLERVRQFLAVLGRAQEDWSHLDGGGFDSVRSLLDAVERAQPDLIITYRHLHSNAWHWPHSLGEYLDVLTQVTRLPVLVLPHPDANHALPHSLTDTGQVMAITDHLTGDDTLVNWALRFTEPGGTCWLTHIESDTELERLLDAISKIPELDTEVARALIPAQLQKEPRDYIRSCGELIASEGLEITIEELVMFGHRVSEYRRLVEEHAIDLLVMHTMDGDQLAMHGGAYPLAVELRQIPILML